MPSPTLTRRAMIASAGATLSSAALAISVVPAVTGNEVCSLPVETAETRIGRLVDELSAALDAEYGGDYEAVIGPDGAVSWRWANPTPAQRAEEHIAGLKKALADLDVGPIAATVQSDGGAVIDHLQGKPFLRRVPPTLWRVEVA